ncbi:MAG: phosphotransferase [Caulobacteraceae bacterium]|nr:phosphotransferase [Caulobacteraceae bacterium]
MRAERVRLIKHGHNSHWRVAADGAQLVLRRYGKGARWTPDAIAWELELLRRLAEAGYPAAAPLAGPLTVDGEVYVLFPFVSGRALRLGAAGYRELGRRLAELHDVMSAHVCMDQKPERRSLTAAAAPPDGGPDREALLARLARLDARLADQVDATSEAIAPRLQALADLPQHPVHGDFAPWNLRMRDGRLIGVFDFDDARLDVLAADVAHARRGYHDAVVDGYLERRPLSAGELAGLDALWLGAVLEGFWHMLAREDVEDAAKFAALTWSREQRGKARPYGG